jgi:hypothetical protein
MMEHRENKLMTENICFTGDDISTAAILLDKMSTTIDILYYLMGRGEQKAFVIIMLSADNINLDQLLTNEKRNTDILFEIDKEKSLYTIICQDTKVYGGYHFAERIMHKIIEQNATNIYLTELEIRTTEHDIRYIIFKLLETFIKIKSEKRDKEIIYSSLK